MPSFEYEPLILSPKPKTSDQEKDKRDIDGVIPLGTRVEEKPKDLRGEKENLEREVAKQTLKQVEFVLQEVSFQKYASAATKIGEQIQHEGSMIQQD